MGKLKHALPHDKILSMRFLVTAVLAFPAILLAQSDVVLIHGAQVIDGTGAAARAVSVRFCGDRIDAVGTDIAAPVGARIVEASGQTLIPGLFDLHTHLSASAVTGVPGDGGKNLKAYLVAGVTTVNDYARVGPSAPFAVSPEWQTIRISLGDLSELAFELSGAPESTVWLELDNVRFY